MTIKHLFDTIDFSSYDKIVVHWPTADEDRDFHNICFEYAEPLIELFGHVEIMTMDETSAYDGGDASLFIGVEPEDKVVIHIYLKREDVIHDEA